jgi:hypothetical protein
MEFALELGNVFGGPGFFYGALKHEGVRSALPEAEQLDHEGAVVAASCAFFEEAVEVRAESVFSLTKY